MLKHVHYVAIWQGLLAPCEKDGLITHNEHPGETCPQVACEPRCVFPQTHSIRKEVVIARDHQTNVRCFSRFNDTLSAIVRDVVFIEIVITARDRSLGKEIEHGEIGHGQHRFALLCLGADRLHL